MSVDKRQRFVERTYEIMKTEGIDAVKIRRLANDLDCTSTMVYRYFDNLDHLIALASMYYLKSYIHDFRTLAKDPMIAKDPYALNMKMWECLAGYAFADIAIYEKLLFGAYNQSLGEIIFEYYQLFLDEEKGDFDGYSVSILFSEDMIQRDYVLLRRASSLGIIDSDDAMIIAEIEVYIFHGILLKYMSRDHEPGIAEKAKAEFLHLIRDLDKKYRLK